MDTSIIYHYLENQTEHNKLLANSNADFIYQNIYLGNYLAADDEQWLKKNNITHILGLIGYQKKFDNIHYIYFNNLDDTPNQDIISQFKVCFEFIEKSLKSCGNILVHCHAGISRSSTIVIAYLMFKYGMNLREAIVFVKKQRPIINPNYGFINQLISFNNLNLDERQLFFGSKL